MTGVGESVTSMILGIIVVILSRWGLALGLLLRSGPGCSLNLMGEIGAGLPVRDRGLPNLVGVGMLDSLAVG